MDLSMDSLSHLLDSMSEEDLQSLRDMAGSMFGTAEKGQKSNPPPDAPDPALLRKLGTLLGQMQHGQDERSALIAALTPYLSAPRRKRAQEAMQFLRLLDVLPLLGDTLK